MNNIIGDLSDHYEFGTYFNDQISLNLTKENEFTSIVIQLLSIWLDKQVELPVEVKELSINDHFSMISNPSKDLSLNTKLRILI